MKHYSIFAILLLACLAQGHEESANVFNASRAEPNPQPTIFGVIMPRIKEMSKHILGHEVAKDRVERSIRETLSFLQSPIESVRTRQRRDAQDAPTQDENDTKMRDCVQGELSKAKSNSQVKPLESIDQASDEADRIMEACYERVSCSLEDSLQRSTTASTSSFLGKLLQSALKEEFLRVQNAIDGEKKAIVEKLLAYRELPSSSDAKASPVEYAKKSDSKIDNFSTKSMDCIVGTVLSQISTMGFSQILALPENKEFAQALIIHCQKEVFC